MTIRRQAYSSTYKSAFCNDRPDGIWIGFFEPKNHPTYHTRAQVSTISTRGFDVFIRVGSTGRRQTMYLFAIETTLFSPWWFTGGTNQAFVLMRNTMMQPTTTHLTLRGAAGDVCAETDVSLNGNGNAAIQVGGFPACAAQTSGSADIAFQGTPGGMVANLTTIDVPNGTSFDAPFVPRMAASTMSR